MLFSAEHRLLAQEGHLASSSLLSGFEALAKIDYDRAGTIYSTLFALSVGLERMMKIAVILEHKLSNDLANPSDKQLKAYGHSLTGLYAKLKNVAATRGQTLGWFEVDTTQGALLGALSEFARGSRYYNFDQLGKGSENPDPLVHWFNVHMQVAEDSLSYRRRSQIMSNAQQFCEKRGLFGWEWGYRGRYDLTIDVTYEHEVARVSRGHCVWTILEIIQPIYRLIDLLVEEAHQLESAKGATSSGVPYLTEFFPFCFATRDDAVRRKAWTRLFRFAGR
ncbi:MAG: hypothetical protein JHC81_10435 [Brevundimonas sp.]|uniref:hypothetical protein n=1 Tax=Brevundimonas sp. TaxID=1871086 RepID=UPI001A1F603F|nr:hypothetical protein [Brevundimonas sp.]MBJ7447939.1 hypothetical protein [Brevundimonas sp.]